jgi:hypothetical protein
VSSNEAVMVTPVSSASVIFGAAASIFGERHHPQPSPEELQHSPAGNVSMADLYPSIAQCAVIATAFKVLLFPA